MTRRVRVGVLFGGRSAEHEVSLQSAHAVLAAIDRARFEVVPIGVTRDGRWLALPDDGADAGTLQRRLEQAEPAYAGPVAMLPMPESSPHDGGGDAPLAGAAGATRLLALDASPPAGGAPIDVMLPLIHGTFGEDGTVQGLFELAGVPYVGSGVLGSAVSMDKAAMKAQLRQAGLPVADYRLVSRYRWRADPAQVRADCEAALGYPLFVKPANLGSSVGVHKVRDPGRFAAAVDDAARYDRRVLVETAIEDAHEVEIAVLGNDEPIASVPGEIVPANEFYDYQAKYQSASSELIIPAPLPAPVVERLQQCAVAAFQALDCAGLARIDFLVRRRDHAVFILEANTLPGFTPISMYPKLWQASGMAYPRLIERLIELAVERYRDRRQNVTRYE